MFVNVKLWKKGAFLCVPEEVHLDWLRVGESFIRVFHRLKLSNLTRICHLP